MDRELTHEIDVSDLALYVTRGCGYCERVLRAIRDLGIEVELRDIDLYPEHRKALVEARGRSTVPVLRIGTAQWLPESRAIIAYLSKRVREG